MVARILIRLNQLRHSVIWHILAPPLVSPAGCIQALELEPSQAPQARIPLTNQHPRIPLANQQPRAPYKLVWSTPLKLSHKHLPKEACNPCTKKKCPHMHYSQNDQPDSRKLRRGTTRRNWIGHHTQACR